MREDNPRAGATSRMDTSIVWAGRAGPDYQALILPLEQKAPLNTQGRFLCVVLGIKS